MKFLITGGAGFIGSNLAFELQEKGNEVTILDDFSSGNFKNLIGFKGDICAYSLTEKEWMEKLSGKYDAIFHQAAITDTTVEDQKKMMQVNVEGFRNILSYAKTNGIKKIVYASSAGVYGNSSCPMTEASVSTPENIYGFSKAIADNVATWFAKNNPDISVIGLRYFNVYGPREYYKGHASSMIFQLHNQMIAGKRPRIFKNGEQMRDFIYVKDVVSANIKALQSEVSTVVNVGTGVPEDFNKVIECLNKELNTKLKTEYFDNPYSFYQNKTQANTQKAKNKIGFKAEYSLDSGISDYVKTLKLGK